MANMKQSLMVETAEYLWMTGIAVSTICLIAQTVLYILRPRIRKMDQKVLMQLAVTRLLYSTFTLIETSRRVHVQQTEVYHLVVIRLFGLMDIALRWWMCAYTKNLYDKIVKVFVPDKWSFLKLSLVVWGSSVVLFALDYGLVYLLKTYDIALIGLPVWIGLKCIPVFINFIFFCKVFYIALRAKTASRNCNNIAMANSTTNFGSLVKICVISFILVCITSVQILVDDTFRITLSLMLNEKNTGKMALQAFIWKNIVPVFLYTSAISSFQGVEIIIIFLILNKNAIK